MHIKVCNTNMKNLFKCYIYINTQHKDNYLWNIYQYLTQTKHLKLNNRRVLSHGTPVLPFPRFDLSKLLLVEKAPYGLCCITATVPMEI